MDFVAGLFYPALGIGPSSYLNGVSYIWKVARVVPFSPLWAKHDVWRQSVQF